MPPTNKRKVAGSRFKSKANTRPSSKRQSKQTRSSGTTKRSAAPVAKKQRTKATPTDMPTLPLDLWYEIVAHIDPRTEKQSLVNLMQVSQSLWEVAAPHLYADMVLDEVQLGQLITGGMEPKFRRREPYSFSFLQGIRRRGISKMTPRTLRAFAFIKRLHLRPPPVAPGIEQLWHATVPNTPLFPNVQHLVLQEIPNQRICPSCKRLHAPRRLDNVPKHDAYKDVILFDTPDVCLCKYSCKWLRYLPANETRIVTYI